MADLKEESKWEPGIRQFETSDPVQGGPDGVDNIALKQLGNRTRYLRDRADAADKVASGLGTRAEATDKKVVDLTTRADAADKKIGDLANDKVAKAGDTLKGKLLGKAGAITPNNTNNAGFAFDRDPDTGMFSPADGHLQLGTQGVPYIAMLTGNMTLGAAGWLSFIAGKTERGRITSEGRWLVGGAADDGLSTMLVQNPAIGYAVVAKRPDIGGQYLALGAAAGIGSSPKDNTLASYSDPGAAKSLIIAASTDAANTAPTNGALGIRFTILGLTRAQIGPTGNLIVGTSAADRETGRFQVVADATGYAMVAYRSGNQAQFIGIGAAPNGPGGVIDNYIDAYSQTAGGKILYLNSTTDANNTTPTGGRLGIGFNILGKTKMLLNQAGRLLIGDVADDGSNLLRVGGGATFASRVTLTSKQGNIEMGSTTEAGTPYIDFHSSGAPRDFDARIIAKGGDAAADGTGNLQYLAGRHSFLIGATEKVTINSSGRVLIGGVADNGSALLQVGGTVTATAPPAGDNSNKLITSAWFAAAVANVQIGQIVWEARTAPRAGFLKLNGTELKRADYPLLWAYAQASGAIVADGDWGKGRHGCFSTGDGNTTFRLPDLRGEFIRCWDDARGADARRQIGSWQDSQNRSHAHGASAAAVGDHSHTAWTDTQGWHGHHGWTGGAGGHNHNNGIFSRMLRPPYGGSMTGSDTAGSGSEQAVGVGDSADIVGVGDHAHEFNTEGAGTHGHNVGIGAAGGHSHTISVAADGGNETRPRNVALLAMIRAY
ncbi:phage tail protein [Burkholderia sp. LA-2-3-30-S1-D2]|uniref:phage tail protein n=1 Tax=Burkholderia sp. LA-2-3-30-S1-D2 TaxID=1637862 RepID=UPI000AC22755|nr:phage tail protein [Burkholderia sp. LA-2-3-30-S1-D2]